MSSGIGSVSPISLRTTIGALAASCLLAHGASAQVPAAAPNPVGDWRGTSLCRMRPSSCNDEIVVYRIIRVNASDSLSVDARKIVNGQEEEMGVLGCHLATSGAQFTCTIPNGVWHFTIRGDSLTGELRLPDNRKFRDINAARSAEGTTNTVYDRVILGGHVMDPDSKLDAVRNIGLQDGRIAVITTQAVRGRDTIDARGLVVAPGFIDIHAHGQTPETYRFYSLDGVTTALELELGTSDVAGWYRERSAGERINYGVSIGHIKVRMAVMHDSGTFMPVGEGAYRAASPAQIGEIAERIGIGLREGAVDIGAGFPYTPAATREELLTVFRVAGITKTPVHVHITPSVAGLKEALSLASETDAPLHVVHINSAGLAETPVMLQMISDARARGQDVTTEAYPYDAGMTEIQSATIQDIYKSAPDARLAELEWPRTGERLNRESFERYSRLGGPVVVHTNTEQMVSVAIKSPLTTVASDAYWQNGTGHPRTTGTFCRVLGHYVRETHALSLMEAIRKMTLMPAQRLEARVPAMRQKGRLRVGADADITIFDAATVMDRSTYREPSLPPVGIQYVIVNGVSVVANARAVEDVAPGKPVRAPIVRR